MGRKVCYIRGRNVRKWSRVVRKQSEIVGKGQEFVWNVPRWSRNGLECSKIVWNGSRRFEMVQDGLKWSKMVWDGPGWSVKVQKGPRWSKLVQDSKKVRDARSIGSFVHQGSSGVFFLSKEIKIVKIIFFPQHLKSSWKSGYFANSGSLKAFSSSSRYCHSDIGDTNGERKNRVC